MAQTLLGEESPLVPIETTDWGPVKSGSLGEGTEILLVDKLPVDVSLFVDHSFLF